MTWSGKLSAMSLRFHTVFLTCVEVVQRSQNQEHIRLWPWNFLTPQMEKQVNLTLIGIATDAVERNPRENTETILPNRPIDLLITSFGVTSSHAVAFPSSHSYTEKRKEPSYNFRQNPCDLRRTIDEMFGREPAVFSLQEIKYGGLCGQDGFWRTVY